MAFSVSVLLNQLMRRSRQRLHTCCNQFTGQLNLGRVTVIKNFSCQQFEVAAWLHRYPSCQINQLGDNLPWRKVTHTGFLFFGRSYDYVAKVRKKLDIDQREAAAIFGGGSP